MPGSCIKVELGTQSTVRECNHSEILKLTCMRDRGFALQSTNRFGHIELKTENRKLKTVDVRPSGPRLVAALVDRARYTASLWPALSAEPRLRLLRGNLRSQYS
jgi:hypothetical protein